MILALQVSYAATGLRAFEQNGKIMLSDPTGSARQLTRSGRDYDPKLSPDGRLVAFCRKVGVDFFSGQIWLVSASENPKEWLVRDSGVSYQKFSLTGCETPDFSPNGKYLYYLLQFSATSGVISRVDLASGDVVAMTDAIGFRVISVGQYRGYFAAYKRKHTLTRVWSWCWLLDPDGKEVGAIGDEEAEQDFIRIYERE